METVSFGPVPQITLAEVKRLFGQACQVVRVHQYWIAGHGWLLADFDDSVEAQILRVILMGATSVNLEIHHHGQVSFADYRIATLLLQTE